MSVISTDIGQDATALAAPRESKQRLSDTYLSYLPKNTSGYTYKNQIVDVQIPKSQHIQISWEAIPHMTAASI